MRIATQTSYLGQLIGDVEAIKLLSKVGYDGIDYSILSSHLAYRIDNVNVFL